MKANLKDPTVCPKCHGTGVEIVNPGSRYEYSRNCDYRPQAELPMDEPTQEESEAA